MLRTLGFYINFHQLAINDHQCCVLAHAFSTQRAEARLGEEMFINGYALKTISDEELIWSFISCHFVTT